MKPIPAGALPVEERYLAPFNSYGKPEFVHRGYYKDVNFTCGTCGEKKTWTAAQQKVWYEKEKGQVYSTAKYCTACRNKRKGGPQKKASTPEKLKRNPTLVGRRLRELGAMAATQDSRREVEEALGSKNHAIQSVAAEVLAKWGGRESVEALRPWVSTLAAGDWHSLQLKAGALLASCMDRSDESWAAALFQELKNKHSRYWLHDLFRRLRKSKRLLSVLKEESRSTAPFERIRALFYLSIYEVENREAVFKALRRDANAAVSSLAIRLAEDPVSSQPAYRIMWDFVLGCGKNAK